MLKASCCLVARPGCLSARSPPDVRALHPPHDPLGILMELSDPLPAIPGQYGAQAGEKIKIVVLAKNVLFIVKGVELISSYFEYIGDFC